MDEREQEDIGIGAVLDKIPAHLSASESFKLAVAVTEMSVKCIEFGARKPRTITRAQVEEEVKIGAREGQFFSSYTIAARTAALNALKAARVEVVE